MKGFSLETFLDILNGLLVFLIKIRLSFVYLTVAPVGLTGLSALNQLKKYKVNFIGSNNEYIDIYNIKAVNISDTEKIQSLISNCEIISTSVGPQYVKNVIEAISNARIDKQVSFIAFENKYRASTSAKEESEFHNENVKFVDVVIDKIVPLQSKESLDVNVEKYGSIVFDDKSTTPLNFSSVVRDGDYDYEFKKKLWMLKMFHLMIDTS